MTLETPSTTTFPIARRDLEMVFLGPAKRVWTTELTRMVMFLLTFTALLGVAVVIGAVIVTREPWVLLGTIVCLVVMMAAHLFGNLIYRHSLAWTYFQQHAAEHDAVSIRVERRFRWNPLIEGCPECDGDMKHVRDSDQPNNHALFAYVFGLIYLFLDSIGRKRVPAYRCESCGNTLPTDEESPYQFQAEYYFYEILDRELRRR